MNYWFSEFLIILCFSKKTQYAIIIGLLGYLTINLVGIYMLRDFQLTGYLAPMSDMVKEKLICKYDNAALCCLGSFCMLAIKQYRKDKKRFYRIW